MVEGGGLYACLNKASWLVGVLNFLIGEVRKILGKKEENVENDPVITKIRSIHNIDMYTCRGFDRCIRISMHRHNV